MAFIVEDGTGTLAATSYIDITFFDAYWTDRGNEDAVGASVSEKQVALILATDYIDATRRFLGFRAVPETQTLEWPREGVITRGRDDIIENNIVPVAVQKATAEVASFALSDELLPNVTHSSAQVLAESKGARGLSISRTFKAQVNTNPILRKALCLMTDLQASNELLRS